MIDAASLDVMIVDDNAQMRAILATILSSFGVRNIQQFADGRGALLSLPGTTADLVICDLLMEPMDGLAVLRAIRSNPLVEVAQLPVIMLSGNRDARSVVEARDSGATEYLVKPVSPNILWRRISQVLRHPRAFVANDRYRGPVQRAPRPDSEIARAFPMDPALLGRAERSPPLKRALADAEQGLAELARDYPLVLAADVGSLTRLIGDAAERGFDPDILRALHKKAHDVKGQAATFGFDLVTTIAGCLCRLLRTVLDEPGLVTARRLAFGATLTMHVDAMRICVEGDVRGAGGADGAELIHTLDMAVRRFQRPLA